MKTIRKIVPPHAKNESNLLNSTFATATHKIKQHAGLNTRESRPFDGTLHFEQLMDDSSNKNNHPDHTLAFSGTSPHQTLDSDTGGSNTVPVHFGLTIPMSANAVAQALNPSDTFLNGFHTEQRSITGEKKIAADLSTNKETLLSSVSSSQQKQLSKQELNVLVQSLTEHIQSALVSTTTTTETRLSINTNALKNVDLTLTYLDDVLQIRLLTSNTSSQPLIEQLKTPLAQRLQQRMSPSPVSIKLYQPSSESNSDLLVSPRDVNNVDHHKALLNHVKKPKVGDDIDQSPLRHMPGDTLLQHLMVSQENISPSRAQAKPSTELNEMLIQMTNRILVSVPSSNTQTDVRITLNTAYLEGTEIVIHRHQGELQVRLLAPSAETQTIMQHFKSDLQTTLEQKLSREGVTVQVDVSRQTDTPSDGRSRNRYIIDNASEETDV